jgi:predicted nuclease with TOPRIM domain
MMSSEYHNQLKEFINAYGLTFLQTITDYLRKELKVPKYSEMYDDKEQLAKETEALFSTNEKLEVKLEQIREVVSSVQNLIKECEDVHVSFGVYESLHQLSEAHVHDFRLLDCLKVQRTSFMPSFDDHQSSSSSQDVHKA